MVRDRREGDSAPGVGGTAHQDQLVRVGNERVDSMKPARFVSSVLAGVLLLGCATVGAQEASGPTADRPPSQRWMESVEQRLAALQSRCEQLSSANRNLHSELAQLASDLAFVVDEFSQTRDDVMTMTELDDAENPQLAGVNEQLASIHHRLKAMASRLEGVQAAEPAAQQRATTPPPTATSTAPPTAHQSAQRPLAAVIGAKDEADALTPAARDMLVKAAGNRIATRIYLSRPVDPTGTFTFDDASVRNHIARRAPSREEGCLFVVDLEGDYYRALRRGDPEQVTRTMNLYLQAILTAKQARPGEPVMVYGLPNRTWSNFDFSVLDPVFKQVDYINVSAYGGDDKTEAQYRSRIDGNVAIAQPIADRFGLKLVAHVNPRYKDGTLVPIDAFLAGMRYVKSKGVNHVVYWQPPWHRITNHAADGKPSMMSDEAWRAAVEQCYVCALLKVFDPDNPVSRSCSTSLPVRHN
jgi:TolA-binding protein